LVWDVVLDATIQLGIRDMNSHSKFLVLLAPAAIFLVANSISKYNLFIFEDFEGFSLVIRVRRVSYLVPRALNELSNGIVNLKARLGVVADHIYSCILSYRELCFPQNKLNECDVCWGEAPPRVVNCLDISILARVLLIKFSAFLLFL
jgi:hypothetical protein